MVRGLYCFICRQRSWRRLIGPVGLKSGYFNLAASSSTAVAKNGVEWRMENQMNISFPSEALAAKVHSILLEVNGRLDASLVFVQG